MLGRSEETEHAARYESRAESWRYTQCSRTLSVDHEHQKQFPPVKYYLFIRWPHHQIAIPISSIHPHIPADCSSPLRSYSLSLLTPQMQESVASDRSKSHLSLHHS